MITDPLFFLEQKAKYIKQLDNMHKELKDIRKKLKLDAIVKDKDEQDKKFERINQLITTAKFTITNNHFDQAASILADVKSIILDISLLKGSGIETNIQLINNEIGVKQGGSVI